MASTKTRGILLSTGVALITATGTLYGASLKTDQDLKQTSNKAQNATPEEKIQSLLLVREDLVMKRDKLQKQIKDIEMRQEETARRKSGKSG